MIAFLLATAAQAALPEIALGVEIGHLHNGDPSFDAFSDSNALPSRGFKAGVQVADPLAVVVGWHHISRGATIYGAGPDIATAYQANEWTLGAKLEHGFTSWFYPYVSVSGMVLEGTMRLDDEPYEDDNPNELQAHGLSPGAMATAGMEFRMPLGSYPVQLTYWLDGGGALLARGTYGNFGDMKPGGFTLHTGVGVRF